LSFVPAYGIEGGEVEPGFPPPVPVLDNGVPPRMKLENPGVVAVAVLAAELIVVVSADQGPPVGNLNIVNEPKEAVVEAGNVTCTLPPIAAVDVAVIKLPMLENPAGIGVPTGLELDVVTVKLGEAPETVIEYDPTVTFCPLITGPEKPPDELVADWVSDDVAVSAGIIVFALPRVSDDVAVSGRKLIVF
jgi:hypothetical protein